MKRMLLACSLALAVASFAAAPGHAGRFNGDWGDGPTTIWVKIKARQGEGLWEACKRVYNWRDVYAVRGDYKGRPGVVWCNIDHSALYDNQPRRQNFNN